MGHRLHPIGALAVALFCTQACYGPVRRQLAQVTPEEKVYLTRASGFTLHHYADSLTKRPLECTLTRATARVRSVTEEWIVIDQVEVTSVPRAGDCRINGTAWVVRADVPGLEVRVRDRSTARTVVLVVVGVPLILAALATLWAFGAYG